MNLRQMEVFHAVMRAGSVTGAAKLLNVTQPAVSTVLRHCEDQLGIKLFERAGGRLRATPDAEALFPDIANVFRRVETISRMAADLAEGGSGSVNVAATMPIITGPLTDAVAEYLQQKPSVKVTIHALPTPQVVARVAGREADFGVAFAPIIDRTVVCEFLANAEISCIMRKDHPLVDQEFLTIEMLARYPLITYAPNSPIGTPLDLAFRQSGVDLIRQVQVNSSVAAFMLAARGVGVALVERILLNSLFMPSLVARPLRPAIHIQAMVIQPNPRRLTKTAQGFLEILKSKVVDLYAGFDQSEPPRPR